MHDQVQVNSDDADAFRFPSLEDDNSDEKLDTYQMLVHIFLNCPSKEEHQIIATNMRKQLLIVSTDLFIWMIF